MNPLRYLTVLPFLLLGALAFGVVKFLLTEDEIKLLETGSKE